MFTDSDFFWFPAFQSSVPVCKKTDSDYLEELTNQLFLPLHLKIIMCLPNWVSHSYSGGSNLIFGLNKQDSNVP